MISLARVALAWVALCLAAPADAQMPGTVERQGSLVSIAPYGPNIVHVTIALDPAEIARGPGPGISGKADAVTDDLT